MRGVLVIQNRRERTYTPDEVDTLQAVAMVVAELVAGGDLVDPRELSTAANLTFFLKPDHDILAVAVGVAQG